MNGDKSPHIVHEAEAQRQHIRIPLPIQVEVMGLKFTAVDWSNGGIGLILPNDLSENFRRQFEQGSILDVLLQFPFSDFGITFPIALEVTHYTTDGNRIGCRFHNPNRQQQALIQYFVTAYISGEVIRIGDVMDVVSRNNYTRDRNIPDLLAGLTPIEIRRRKVLNTLKSFSLAGLFMLLLIYVSLSLYERLFVVTSSSAYVSAEMLTVDAPAGGKIYYYPIPADSRVVQGKPLLNISTAAGNLIAVDSPCDCIVKRRLADNNRLVRKGMPVLELTHPDAIPAVEAYIPQKYAVKLAVGEEALISLPGSSRYLRGKITTIQAGRGQNGNSLIHISPQRTLPVSAIDDPVEVRIDTLHWL